MEALKLVKRIIDSIFSDKYVNHEAVAGNFVLLLMYRLAYPFAALLNKLHLSPNQITTQSLIFSILALFALNFDQGWVWFTICWGMTVLLDFCDGTVARMTNRVSKSAFRYDHMSDLVKIALVLLGVGLRYNETLIWVMAFSACFGFMYGDALDSQLVTARSNQRSINTANSLIHVGRLRDRNSMVGWLVKHTVLFAVVKNLHAGLLILLTVNGHTLLLFLLFPLGRDFVLLGLSYLILLELWTIKSRISPLVIMRR